VVRARGDPLPARNNVLAGGEGDETARRRIAMLSRLATSLVTSLVTSLATSLALIAGLSPVAGLAAERPVVVELFTSQGCNSCPPANAYLNELSKQRRDVLALAFHVTYWDRLGWKDPFSLQAATERQAVYGRRFGDGSYTPEIVVDGAASMVGSHRGDVGSAIENAKRNSQTAATMSLTRSGDQLSIEVGPGSGNARILLVGFDHEHTTAIGRGENSGRTLTEANVVRSIKSVGQWSGARLRISERLPDGQDCAVMLEAPDGRIIGASRLVAGGST
jgi:hypothetical protein